MCMRSNFDSCSNQSSNQFSTMYQSNVDKCDGGCVFEWFVFFSVKSAKITRHNFSERVRIN